MSFGMTKIIGLTNRLAKAGRRMNTSRKFKPADKLLGLMIVAGFMLIIAALPFGLVLSLQDHYKFHSDWHWAIVMGIAMTAATAIVGTILLFTGEFIIQRRKKTKAG